MTTQTQDQLIRYVFEDVHMRGELVQLNQSYKSILETHDYPPVVAKVLGDLMSATSLLTATLKFTGDIAVQIQGEGQFKYVAINGTDQQKLRGVARWDGDISESEDLQVLFPKGYMLITITPENGERYQGVVALEKSSVAECLEDYFEQSEQLRTKIYLHTDTEREQTAGMLLQVLPAEQPTQEDIDHLDALTSTISSEELFSLDAESVLLRLYHQEKVRVYEPQQVSFECGCSREKCAGAIRNIGKAEALDIVAEQAEIDIKCEYCNTNYRFDAVDVESIFSGAVDGSSAIN